MFVHNIDPVIVSIGSFDIRWYGLFYVVGFVLAYYWMRYVARKGFVKNLTEDSIDNLMIAMVIGVIGGGRILQFVFYRPLELFTNPLEIFMVWHGGMSFHGGLIGAILAGWWFARKYKISLLQLADQIIIPTAFALGLGRIANFINGELYGTITNVAWCGEFPPAEGCRHPTQIYESLKTFFVFGVLFAVRNKPRKDGTLLYLFVFMYGVLRFLLNFYRDESPIFAGISMGQLLSLLMGLLGLGMLIRNYYIHQNEK